MSLSWVPEIRRETAINRSISKFYHSSRRLRKEVNRLKTFDDWPLSFIDRKKLAKDGFFYTKTEDVCRCAFCFIHIGYWLPGDDVRKNHRTASPDCPIVRGLPCENIPIPDEETETGEGESDSDSDSESEMEIGPEVGIDVCGPYGMEIRPFSRPERGSNDSLLSAANHLCKYFKHYGVSKMTGPVAPQFAVFETRLATYDCWKYSDIQKPEKLAEAGFYHIRRGDQVLCFYCGAGLHKWKPEDDPWVEHARHSFKCGFVILQRGTEFVQDALEKRKTILTPSEVRHIINNSEYLSESQVEEETQVEKIICPPVNPLAGSEERIRDLKQNTGTSDESELKLCGICYVREREIVFLPCGHFISCSFCASSLNACALCRTKLEAVVRSSLTKDSEGNDLDKCMVCKTAQREVVFLPCRHFISCSKCAKPKTSCALCQKRIKFLVRAFMS